MSDIKFETINGTLCRMVEPEPLTLDSNLPCVVRYIQDDSPMGRYLKRKYYEVINTVIEVNRIGFDNRVYSSDKTFIEEIECLEIIGYPVEEGSHWWALWQMQNGKAVRNTATGFKFVLRNDLICHVCEEKTGFTYTVYDWLNGAAKSGWQLYEPEPEFKVGDWVEMDYKGTLCHRQVISVHDNGIRVEFVGATPLLSFDGENNMVSMRLVRKLKPSEVRVKITMEGQVTKPVDNAGGRFWLYYSTDEYVSIELDALSHKDRELVESLLEAQEEK